MIKLVPTILIFLIASLSFSQEKQRVEVTGKIIVKDNEIEGITVFNSSSEMGTISDFDGNFKIEVGLHDRVEISALQFQKFTVIIDEGIVSERKMTVYLIEQVNKLPEILVSPYDLTGNIVVDVKRTKTTNLPFKEGEFDLDEMPIDLTNDYKSEVYNPFVIGAGGKADQLGGDILGLVGMFLKPIFKKKNKKPKNREDFFPSVLGNSGDLQFDLRDMYNNKQLSDLTGIPEAKANEFIVYAEDNGLNYNLLRQGKELEFVEALILRSKSFLAIQGDED